MHAWDTPRDPDPEPLPPGSPEAPEDDRRPTPDPEAQRAPGAGDEEGDRPSPPPMIASA